MRPIIRSKTSKFAIFAWAIGLLVLTFVLGIVAAGGVYETTALNPTTGQYVISNKISGISWSRMMASCVQVDFSRQKKKTSAPRGPQGEPSPILGFASLAEAQSPGAGASFRGADYDCHRFRPPFCSPCIQHNRDAMHPCRKIIEERLGGLTAPATRKIKPVAVSMLPTSDLQGGVNAAPGSRGGSQR
jgi:hypothetical protein